MISPHIGDVGTIFEATVVDETNTVVDLSSQTALSMIFRRPDGQKLTRTASLTTNGTDGKLRYTTVAGDLAMPGPWKVQAYVSITAGKWTTDPVEFTVQDNL